MIAVGDAGQDASCPTNQQRPRQNSPDRPVERQP